MKICNAYPPNHKIGGHTEQPKLPFLKMYDYDS